MANVIAKRYQRQKSSGNIIYGNKHFYVVDDYRKKIVNSSGGTLSEFTIHANSEETFDFYVEKAANATFVNDSKTTTISIDSAGIPRVNVGSITLLVTQNATVTDTIPPVVGRLLLGGGVLLLVTTYS